MSLCYCNSQKLFKDCCEPYIKGLEKAPTAEALMRSRYSAYATHQADYLVKTTHVSQRSLHSKEDILLWATSNQWQKLEVLKSTPTTVEFKAYYLDQNKKTHIHHEFSTFVQEDGIWYYVDGEYY
ncbi:YchJ family protein [Flavobacterium commune]|uniref:Preprotein translocase subunit SecA n=1 Tax=Flavobacterium commune TaxID=1306519 RepID=A0A1D9PCU1_9FLAO|nr:YchJ family metal-binding protein [Flavobacterium commune]APA00409.1 preprotein translocase subunit SecA [Flavobacterium commune]